MADVNIDATSTSDAARGRLAQAWVTDQIGYHFYIDSSLLFSYSKTTNGGATWSAAVSVGGSSSCRAYSIWFDQWNLGDSGTLIHCAWTEDVSDDVFYNALDTNGDTLGTQRTVFAGATEVVGRGVFVSLTKALDGKIYVAYDIDAGAEKGFHRSTDGGVTWSASLSATFVEATLDEVFLLPAYNTGDQADVLAVYMDSSATALTLKMWDSSAATAGESATIQTFLPFVNDTSGQYGYAASVRWSDGHIILASCNDRDTATADHQVFDLNCTGVASFTITTKTAITTNIDDHYYPSVYINQNNGDIYVSYSGARTGAEALGSATKVYYVKSTDGGTTWSSGDTAYMEGAASGTFQTWTPPMGPRFYVAWRDGSAIVGNAVNSLALNATTGAGTITVAGLSTAGVGKSGVLGSGAITVAGLSSAGVGKAGVKGDGAITVGGLSTQGTGSNLLPITGNGAITPAGLSSSGVGKSGVIGSGAIQPAGVGTSGAGAQTFSGLGAVTVGGLVTAGVGKVGSIGSGNLTVGGLALSGTANVTGGPTTGFGTITLGGLSLSGTGTVTPPPTGAGTIGIGGLALSGFATVTPPVVVTPIDPWFPGRSEAITWELPARKPRRLKHRHPLRVPRALRPIVELPVEFPPPLIVPPTTPAPAPLTLPPGPFDLPPAQAPLGPVSPLHPQGDTQVLAAEPEGAHWSEYAHQPFTCRDEIEDMELILAAVVRSLRD